MKNNIVVILWSLSVLAALFIGQALNDPVSFTDSAEDQIYKTEALEENIRPRIEKALPEDSKSQQETIVKSVAQSPVKVPVSISSVIQDLVNNFEKSNYNNFDHYRHMADTWEKLKDLDEEQLLEVYSQLDAESEKGVNWNIARIIYARMGELNPGNAIEHAMANKQGHAINGVINSWSKNSPLEALEWIKNNKENFPKTNNVDYYGLFQNIAKQDMNKAIESLKDFDLVKQRNAFNGILKTAESSEEFMNILGKVDGFTDANNKVGSALYYWSQKSPLDAVAWAETMEDDKDKKNAFKKIESAWLRKNPLEAADWIMTQKEDKNQAVSSIVNGWNWKDGESLYKWVQSQDDEDARDSANYKLVGRYAYNNADLAKQAVEEITSEEIRKKAITQLYKSMRYRNHKAAVEFLKGRKEIPEEEKEKLLSMNTRR